MKREIGFFHRNKILNRILTLGILVFTLANISSSVIAQSTGGEDEALQSAKQLLAKLTPAQRVGQLFLVTYQGNEISADSPIHDLIVNHYISGVVLKRDNDNFVGSENTIQQAYNSITTLQNAAAELLPSLEKNTLQLFEGEVEPYPETNYIPLFAGIAQEGDLAPFDEMINGLTPLPDQMAIGATWDPELAKNVGETLGKELHTLGFNLFLGPSLDVLDINYTGSGDDLGTRTFGGDPFWVSQMGRAYINGLHIGGNNQLTVIAKNFPGRGGSDRLPESEVATVRKSLDQLKLIELVPFFSVTGNAKDISETADGLLLSHIRYQGLQGNIRATTKPVSLDPNALDVLMKLPELATWRDKGGLIVSDDLGSQAVRRFFDPTGKSFDARQVILNAFLAGNDLLYMDHILATGDPDTNTTILHILDFFTQKYQEDRAFADRVDESVIRILTLKFRMYPTFDIKYVLPNVNGLKNIGNSNEVSFEVARKAVTLISPGSKDLSTALPRPPQKGDSIVFFTDVLNAIQCSTCKPQAGLGVDEFQKIVTKLYGPSAGGQILPNRLSSYSFTDLSGFLNSPINRLDIQSDIERADWLIFSILNIDPNRPESNILSLLLSERPDLVQQKKVIVFAFNTPYRLDATDISNATAYYGIYSKIPAFVEIAARVLFQEINPLGASPVSIPGVAYDLSTITSPEPNQIISLVVDVENISKPSITSAQPTQSPVFFMGDVLPLKTGVILDHNGHPVPDGTVVKFFFNLTGDKLMNQQTDAVVVDGVARTTFRIQDPGMLEIRASSDPANNSDILLLNISVGKSVVVSAITPTMNPVITEQTKSIPDSEKTAINPIKPSLLSPLGEWLIVLIVIWAFALMMIWVGNYYLSLQWGLRAGLMAVIFGLTAYLWILLGLPGSSFYYLPNGLGITILIVILSSGIGIFIQYLWQHKNPIK